MKNNVIAKTTTDYFVRIGNNSFWISNIAGIKQKDYDYVEMYMKQPNSYSLIFENTTPIELSNQIFELIQKAKDNE